MTSTAIVTWGSLRRASTSTLSSIALSMNTFLGINGTSDAITPEALALLGDYFCDKLPFSAGYKGRMFLNSGADNDFKLGGLFVVRASTPPHSLLFPLQSPCLSGICRVAVPTLIIVVGCALHVS